MYLEDSISSNANITFYAPEDHIADLAWTYFGSKVIDFTFNEVSGGGESYTFGLF